MYRYLLDRSIHQFEFIAVKEKLIKISPISSLSLSLSLLFNMNLSSFNVYLT